jgi:hypothetical protein
MASSAGKEDVSPVQSVSADDRKEGDEVRKEAPEIGEEVEATVSEAEESIPEEEVAVVEASDMKEYFDGRIEINVAPPVSVGLLLKIVRQLRDTQGVNILQTGGSMHEGSVVLISLDEPLPILDVWSSIENLPEVKLMDESESLPESGAEKGEKEDKEESGMRGLFAAYLTQGTMTRILIGGGGSFGGKTVSGGMPEDVEFHDQVGKKQSGAGLEDADEVKPSRSERKSSGRN